MENQQIKKEIFILFGIDHDDYNKEVPTYLQAFSFESDAVKMEKKIIQENNDFQNAIKAHLNAKSEYIRNHWQKAKKIGITKEQFNIRMNTELPKYPTSPAFWFLEYKIEKKQFFKSNQSS